VALFLEGALLGLYAALSPGPFQAYLLAQSIRNGAVRSLPLALVPLTSDPPVIAVVLAALSQVPEGLLRALQVVGGGIVLWLAVTTLRGALRPERVEARVPPRGFVRAALLNFTNPNAWIFWSAIGGPTLATAWRSRPALGLAFLAGFYALLTAGNGGQILLAGGAARLGPRFQRAVALVSGLALLGFGVWQIAKAAAGTR
jgi:threonine/homoserine/homoserine lactone efflux protein